MLAATLLDIGICRRAAMMIFIVIPFQTRNFGNRVHTLFAHLGVMRARAA